MLVCLCPHRRGHRRLTLLARVNAGSSANVPSSESVRLRPAALSRVPWRARCTPPTAAADGSGLSSGGWSGCCVGLGITLYLHRQPEARSVKVGAMC